LLVSDTSDVNKNNTALSVRALRLEHIQTLSAPAGQADGELVLAQLPQGLAVDQAITRLEAQPGVAFAQKNWLYTHQQVAADDAEYINGNLWGMYGDDQPTASGPAGTTNQFGAQAEKAWAAGHTGARDVCVAVLDEGVEFEHPDLRANIWVNPGEVPDNGVDDDRNGYVDDLHGWDFFNEDNSVYDGGPSGSADAHGTHVAGTIGAVGGNGIGVAGVNWQVTIIPVKFLGPVSGTTDKAVQAIDYLIKLKQRGVNIVAINASWGSPAYDLALLEAIKRAARAGILFIAAAGNGDRLGRPINVDNIPFYPACYDTTANTSAEGGTTGVDYDSIISVAALNSTGRLASFSNFGATMVDLAAPGDDIVSTWPAGDYLSDSGTSMATPHVAGAVALYASLHGGARADSIKAAILAAATPTAALAGQTVTGGRLNIGGL
ncbi:MAG TPA: S8 family peptidase, partial [Pyrinomonadaceae bacterium]